MYKRWGGAKGANNGVKCAKGPNNEGKRCKQMGAKHPKGANDGGGRQSIQRVQMKGQRVAKFAKGANNWGGGQRLQKVQMIGAKRAQGAKDGGKGCKRCKQ